MLYYYFFQFLLIDLISIIFILITGKMILSFLNLRESQSTQLNLLIELLFGTIIIVLIYSIFKSNFVTTNIILIPIIIFIGKKKFNTFSKEPWEHTLRDILVCIVYFLPIYLYIGFYGFKSGTFNFKFLYTDNYSYANYIDVLRYWGKENKFYELNIFTDIKGISAYHYGELWLAAFLSEIFNISSVNSYFFCAVVILGTIIFLGFSAVYELFNKNSVLNYFISFISLFIGGVLFEIYFKYNFLSKTDPAGTYSCTSFLSFCGQKYTFIYPLGILSFIYFYIKKHFNAILVLSVIPVFSIGTLPGIIGGSFLLLFTNSFHKSLNKTQILYFISFIAYIILSFYLLNIFFPSAYNNLMSFKYTVIYNLFKMPFDTKVLNLFLFNISKPILIIFLFYFPFLILLKFSEIRFITIGLLVVFICLSGDITIGLLTGMLDHTQFLLNILFFLNIFIAFLIGNAIYIFMNYNLSGIKRISLISIFIILSIFLFHNEQSHKIIKWRDTSDNFITNIYKLIEKNDFKDKPLIIGNFYSQNEYCCGYPYIWTCVNNPAANLMHLRRNLYFTNLNPQLFLECNTVLPVDYSFYQITPINIFSGNNPDAQHLLKFIKSSGIKYILKSSGATIPDEIKNFVTSTYHDNLTNADFYVINTNTGLY